MLNIHSFYGPITLKIKIEFSVLKKYRLAFRKINFVKIP